MGPPSPIQSLPLEVISRVFVFYVQSSRLRYYKIPIILGLVCKRWRAAALITHALWTRVTIAAPGKPSKRAGRHIMAIVQWLARSGDLPCQFEMTIDHHEQAPILASILPAIAHRVAELDLRMTLNDLRQSVYIFNQGLPRLESLVLYITGPYEEVLDITPGVIQLSFSACPNLQDLYLGRDIPGLIGDARFAETLPLDLLYIQASNLTPSTILDLLTRCDKLEDLNLDNCELVEPVPLLQTDEILPFVHKSLNTLTIDYEGEGFGPILQAVRFPRLTTLVLGSLEDMEGTLDAITTASPLLETLDLSNISLTSNELIRCLGRVPRVKSLSLRGCNCFDKRLVSALTFSPGRRVQLLPKLKDLHIDEDSIEGQKATDTEVVDLVWSRWSLGVGLLRCCKIKDVEINANVKPIGKGDDKRILDMKKQGLRIKFNC